MTRFWKWIVRALGNIGDAIAADWSGYPPEVYQVIKKMRLEEAEKLNEQGDSQ